MWHQVELQLTPAPLYLTSFPTSILTSLICGNILKQWFFTLLLNSKNVLYVLDLLDSHTLLCTGRKFMHLFSCGTSLYHSVCLILCSIFYKGMYRKEKKKYWPLTHHYHLTSSYRIVFFKYNVADTMTAQYIISAYKLQWSCVQ